MRILFAEILYMFIHGKIHSTTHSRKSGRFGFIKTPIRRLKTVVYFSVFERFIKFNNSQIKFANLKKKNNQDLANQRL